MEEESNGVRVDVSYIRRGVGDNSFFRGDTFCIRYFNSDSKLLPARNCVIGKIKDK